MKTLMKNELDRALKNKWLYITFLVSLIIIIYDMYKVVIPTRKAMDIYINSWGYPIPNLYNRWMELCNSSTASKLFHFTFPLLVCIPYSASIYSDVESKYIYSIITKIDKKKYFLSKLITQFIVGVVIVMFTMVVSFALTAVVLPAGKPIPGLQYTANGNSIFGAFFYKHPLIVSILIMLLESVLFSLIGCLSYTFAYVLRNGVMVIVSAFTIYFFEEVITPLLGVKKPMIGCSYLINLTYNSLAVFIIEIIVVLAIIACTYFLRIRKKDEL